MREEDADPTPRAPQIPRWPACSCADVERGGCSCYEDDGMVTHGGSHVEAFDHGNARGGERVSA